MLFLLYRKLYESLNTEPEIADPDVRLLPSLTTAVGELNIGHLIYIQYVRLFKGSICMNLFTS